MEGKLTDIQHSFRDRMGTLEGTLPDILNAVSALQSQSRPGAQDRYDPSLSWGASSNKA